VSLWCKRQTTPETKEEEGGGRRKERRYAYEKGENRRDRGERIRTRENKKKNARWLVAKGLLRNQKREEEKGERQRREPPEASPREKREEGQRQKTRRFNGLKIPNPWNKKAKKAWEIEGGNECGRRKETTDRENEKKKSATSPTFTMRTLFFRRSAYSVGEVKRKGKTMLSPTNRSFRAVQISGITIKRAKGERRGRRREKARIAEESSVVTRVRGRLELTRSKNEEIEL